MKAAAISSKAQLRRWIRARRAAELAESRVAEQEGAQPNRAITLSLSIIEAARIAGVPADPLREREVAGVRKTWRRLRRPWTRSASLRS